MLSKIPIKYNQNGKRKTLRIAVKPNRWLDIWKFDLCVSQQNDQKTRKITITFWFLFQYERFQYEIFYLLRL